jgi:hypothetical protein
VLCGAVPRAGGRRALQQLEHRRVSDADQLVCVRSRCDSSSARRRSSNINTQQHVCGADASKARFTHASTCVQAAPATLFAACAMKTHTQHYQQLLLKPQLQRMHDNQSSWPRQQQEEPGVICQSIRSAASPYLPSSCTYKPSTAQCTRLLLIWLGVSKGSAFVDVANRIASGRKNSIIPRHLAPLFQLYSS